MTKLSFRQARIDWGHKERCLEIQARRAPLQCCLSRRLVTRFFLKLEEYLNPDTGVPTGILQASGPQKWDTDALEAMSSVHQSHSSDRSKGYGLEPQDIAQCLLFLVSNHSKRINGAIIPVDNAWSVI